MEITKLNWWRRFLAITQRERYYIQNNECVNKQIPGRTSKEYHFDNKEEFKEKSKKYYENNREQIIEHQSEYYKNNKENVLAYHKKILQKN